GVRLARQFASVGESERVVSRGSLRGARSVGIDDSGEGGAPALVNDTAVILPERPGADYRNAAHTDSACGARFSAQRRHSCRRLPLRSGDPDPYRDASTRLSTLRPKAPPITLPPPPLQSQSPPRRPPRSSSRDPEAVCAPLPPPAPSCPSRASPGSCPGPLPAHRTAGARAGAPPLPASTGARWQGT